MTRSCSALQLPGPLLLLVMAPFCLVAVSAVSTCHTRKPRREVHNTACRLLHSSSGTLKILLSFTESGRRGVPDYIVGFTTYSMLNIPVTLPRPPLDGTLTVDGICDWHSIHSPDAAAFVFPNMFGDPSLSTITWKEMGNGILTGIDIIEKRIPEIDAAPSGGQGPIVVGILASLDAITETTFLFSHIRLTHPTSYRRTLLPFPLSPRNFPGAISHLACTTGMKYLWYTEGPMKALMEEALSQGGLSDVTTLEMPSFSDLYSSSSLPLRNRESESTSIALGAPALMLHSSGSTAFPKSLILTHEILLEWSRGYGQADLTGVGGIVPTHGSPLCNGLGVLIALWAAVGADGLIRAAPCPHLSIPLVTAEYFWKEIIRTKSTILIIVPSFLEAWSHEPQNLEKLKEFKVIFTGGAPLHDEIGSDLHAEGVLVHNLFGATESGITSLMSNKVYAEGHEWFEFATHVSPSLRAEGEEGRVFELLLKETPSHHLSTLNTEIDGTPAYATNDLIERHATNSALFRVRGRKDDQITLSTGAKTNPGPLVSIIVKDTHVKNAVMFGRGRSETGIIIEPESHEMIERLGPENFRDIIWPTVEAANDHAPIHSRIRKEMVIIASSSKPFTYTLKHTARKGAILDAYAPEIEAIYNAGRS